MRALRKLDTVQKENKLNNVYSVDNVGPGGAHHEYLVGNNDTREELLFVQFQKGPRTESDSVQGVLDGDLLEIVRDRLTHFQKGDYACEENELALRHVEAALNSLANRAYNRAKRGVLGTYNK